MKNLSNRIGLTMAFLFVISTGVVFLLFMLAGSDHASSNGFRRIFSHIKYPAAIDTIDLTFDSYYIAGRARHEIYLANLVAPTHLTIINPVLGTVRRAQVKIGNTRGMKFWSLKVKVDSPNIYLGDGTVPVLFSADLKELGGTTMDEKFPYFLDFEPLGKRSFAVRGLDAHHVARLGKVSSFPFHVEYPAGLLVQQLDGIFCTDGVMHYDKEHGRLLYLYFYRNQYLVMDSCLVPLWKGNTIDTTSRARIKVATIESSNSRTFSAPPVRVNKGFDVRGSTLFVNSALRSDNENSREFWRSSVVDVYNLDEKRYVSSFYLPKVNGSEMRQFRVVGSTFVALYKREIVTYDIGLLKELFAIKP